MKSPAPERRTGDAHPFDPECGCEICRQRMPFSMPDELVQACVDGDLVVFAGAGVSTESRLVLPFTLYEDIRGEFDLDDDVSFPGAMTAYSERFGRAGLLRKIRGRFEYIRSFPELHYRATAFHRELSTIFPLVDIVTTNWDTGFEDECGATPIVSGTDYAFWDEPGRKVFKLHGSITSWGSVIATDADYERVEKELSEGAMGGSLRHLLATKSVLFAGYSFGDPDFRRIYDVLRDEMGEVLPRSFAVTLDPRLTEETLPGATILRTDATYLLEGLKEKLVFDDVLLDDSVFGRIEVAQEAVAVEHTERTAEMDLQEYPAVVFALSYQDGLLHAFERALARRNTGEYSNVHRIAASIAAYEQMSSDRRKRRRYWDVAYIAGYINGLIFVLAEEEHSEDLPLYFVFGSDGDVRNFDEFGALLPDTPELHKTAFAAAKRIVKSQSGDTVPHHIPTLM